MQEVIREVEGCARHADKAMDGVKKKIPGPARPHGDPKSRGLTERLGSRLQLAREGHTVRRNP